MYSKREAIEKMECKKRECKYLDENGIYTFCKAIFSEEFCKRRDKRERDNDKETV